MNPTPRSDGEERPFAEIDADDFAEAQRDPRIHAFAKAADEHMERLCAEGRIEPDPPTPPHHEQRCPTCKSPYPHIPVCLSCSPNHIETTHELCHDPFHFNPLPPDPHEGGETWTIYRRVGEWDDVIQGPDTPEEGVEVVPASILQSLTAERDEAIKKRDAAIRILNDERADAAGRLTQLQAAHRADLERVAGELEKAKRCLDTAMHKGSLRVRGEIAEKFVRGAKNHVALAIQSLSTKDTEE